MKYKDLRDFISQLENRQELKRIAVPVSTRLEMTEISDRVLRAGGPALLFENANNPGNPQVQAILRQVPGSGRAA